MLSIPSDSGSLFMFSAFTGGEGMVGKRGTLNLHQSFEYITSNYQFWSVEGALWFVLPNILCADKLCARDASQYIFV